MGYVLINESILSSIGNILRSKYNANVSFSTSMMHNDIDNISKWNDIVQDSNFNVSISTYNMNSLYRKCAKYLNLTILDCPSIIISSSFTNFTNLVSISLPNCSYIGSYAFTYCNNLSYISIPNCSYIGGSAFYFCSKLESIYILSTKVPALNNSNAFNSTPISRSTYLGYFGSIYVLSTLVNSFKTATNWKVYSSRIVAYTP